MTEDFWELIAALLPEGVQLNPQQDGIAEITDEQTSIKIIYNEDDNSYVIGDQTLHFEDTDYEIINTLLVPYILQQLDNQRRI